MTKPTRCADVAVAARERPCPRCREEGYRFVSMTGEIIRVSQAFKRKQ